MKPKLHPKHAHELKRKAERKRMKSLDNYGRIKHKQAIRDQVKKREEHAQEASALRKKKQAEGYVKVNGEWLKA